MSRAQRVALLLGAVGFVLAVLFPRWEERPHGGAPHWVPSFRGHHLFLRPPPRRQIGGVVGVARAEYAATLVLAALAGAVAWCLAADRDRRRAWRERLTRRWTRATRVLVLAMVVPGLCIAAGGLALFAFLPREAHGKDILVGIVTALGLSIAFYGWLACLLSQLGSRLVGRSPRGR